MMFLCRNMFIYVVFYDFTSFLKDSFDIHKYANSMNYKSDHRKKNMCLRYNLTPILVL